MPEIEADSPEEIGIEPDTDRSEVIDDLERVMQEAHDNAFDGRVRNAEKQRVRIKWLKGYVSAVSEYRKLVKDVRGADQEARIERLENMVDELE
jgi:acylphosphatase